MRYVLLAVLMAFAAPVQAFSCLFESECYEDQGCAESQFTIEVLLEHEIIATDFGDLTIVAVKSSDTLITLFATGSSSEYMMSVTPEAARMSAHINKGPVMVGYLGTCEGAF